MCVYTRPSIACVHMRDTHAPCDHDGTFRHVIKYVYGLFIVILQWFSTTDDSQLLNVFTISYSYIVFLYWYLFEICAVTPSRRIYLQAAMVTNF